MERRQFLQGITASVLFVTTGCQTIEGDSEDWDCEKPLRVDGEEPILNPGDQTIIRILVENTVKLRVRFPQQDYYDIGPVSVSPSPDKVNPSEPPIWNWKSCTNARVDAPIQVAADARPGKFEYVVDVDSEERRFAITISDD